MRLRFLVLLGILFAIAATAEDGYNAWLRYAPIADPARLDYCRTHAAEIVFPGAESGDWSRAAGELRRGLSGMLGVEIPVAERATRDGAVILIVKPTRAGDLLSGTRRSLEAAERQKAAEGYLIFSTTVDGKACTIISSETDRGLIYGAFAFLRRVATGGTLSDLSQLEQPAAHIRMINHWDNLSMSVERGYAGKSIFRWDQLPIRDSRTLDYARMLASVGINAIAINNVNAQPAFLSTENLEKVAIVAEDFREYGVQVFLSANFAAPEVIGGVSTADPLHPEVRAWWKAKANEIYRLIPDFGGVLVKANSERQPGPNDYGRTHVDGANMLAEAFAPHGGVVIWRAFVYAPGQDRAREAYDSFEPFDGKFADNVILQAKNGPIDFQAREPVSPLFGQMPETNMMIELQVTQEYLGRSTHLVYLIPQWKEVLDFDTYAAGRGATVKKIISAQLFDYPLSGMAGVANVGRERNWTGHHFAASNLYGFGRLAWNPDLSAEEIAEEWAMQTWSGDPAVVATLRQMMLPSWEIYEKYTSPLGIGVMCASNHYDPNPAFRAKAFMHADARGVGYDRTTRSGSRYVEQYRAPVARRYDDLSTCPDELLLFFHHVPYTHRLHSDKTVLQHIYDTHYEGVEDVRTMLAQWESLLGSIDNQRYREVHERLDAQIAHAEKWRDVVNRYFYELSEIPDELGRVQADVARQKQIEALPAPTP